jgi:transposase
VLKIPVPITKKEVRILTEHYHAAGSNLIRQRAHALLLVRQKRTVPDIASILLVREETVRRWLHAFVGTRIESVFHDYTDNTNASRLTELQRKEIKDILEKPPSTYGIPAAFWSVGALKQYMTATYGIVYESDRSYHHLFQILRYSFKLPTPFDKRRDDALVVKRMKQIRAQIKTLTDHEIFAADECSIVWETELRRAWLKRGEKTILKVDRTKQRQNYFGALNLRSHKHTLVPLMWQNTETITDALRALTKQYPNKKLAIIWDNAAWHRSKVLRALLGRTKEFSHITLIWMPPYAPDENPQEHVWKYGKEAIANRVYANFEELKERFETSLLRKFEYRM